MRDASLAEYWELLVDDLAASMKKVGSPSYQIYAVKKTGLLVTESMRPHMRDEDLVAWDEAVEEYFQQHPDERCPPASAGGTASRPRRQP